MVEQAVHEMEGWIYYIVLRLQLTVFKSFGWKPKCQSMAIGLQGYRVH